jgi:hypothetical protein
LDKSFFEFSDSGERRFRAWRTAILANGASAIYEDAQYRFFKLGSAKKENDTNYRMSILRDFYHETLLATPMQIQGEFFTNARITKMWVSSIFPFDIFTIFPIRVFW